MRKYRIQYYDGDYYSWQVVGPDGKRCAEFWGKWARQYAIDHAMLMNSEAFKEGELCSAG